MEGWIKLHRKFIYWEWYSDIYTTSLFVHLLLSANFKDVNWQGIVIKRGQLVTSYEKLSNALGEEFGIQRVRTCLARLCKTGEITRVSTNKYTIITICNYDYYQDDNFQTNTQTNNQITINQQSTNNQLTTKEEYKERKELKNNLVVVDKAREIENFRNEIYGSQIKLEAACKTLRLDAASFYAYAEEVIARWRLTEPDEVNWSHLINAIAVKKNEDDRKVQKNGEASEKAQRRAQLQAFAEQCYLESIKPTN